MKKLLIGVVLAMLAVMAISTFALGSDKPALNADNLAITSGNIVELFGTDLADVSDLNIGNARLYQAGVREAPAANKFATGIINGDFMEYGMFKHTFTIEFFKWDSRTQPGVVVLSDTETEKVVSLPVRVKHGVVYRVQYRNPIRISSENYIDNTAILTWHKATNTYDLTGAGFSFVNMAPAVV